MPFLVLKWFAMDRVYIKIEKNGITSFQTMSEIGHLYKLFFFIESELASSCTKSPSRLDKNKAPLDKTLLTT